jgi:MFS family permease
MALLDATLAVFGVLAQTQWGKLADRIGQREVLRICMLLVVPLPLFWLAATPERIWPLFIGNALGGIAWSGLGMAQINRLMEQAPCEGRCSYMATFSVATGVPFLLASLGAGTLMSMIGVTDMTLLGLTFHPYLAFFVASGACRLVAFVIGWRVV